MAIACLFTLLSCKPCALVLRGPWPTAFLVFRSDPTPTSSPSTTSNVPADGLPLPQRRKAIFVILLGITLVVLDGTIVTLALPSIANAFGVTASTSVWIITSYQLAVLGLLLPMASLGERFGYRQVYLGGMALFAVASALCFVSQAFWHLVLCRVAQGLAGAAVMGVNAALVRQTYPSHLLGRGIALNAVTVAIASVAGPSLAALILSVADWPWLFAINVPLAIVTIVLGRHHLPVSMPTQHQRFSSLDWVLNIAAFGLIFWAFDGLITHGFANGQLTDSGQISAAALAASLVLWIWYVRRQRKLATPLLPLDLLRIPAFSLSMGASICAFSSQMLAFIALPFLSLSILQQSPFETGILVSVWPIAIAMTAPFAGRLIGRVPGASLGLFGMVTLAVGLGAMAAMPLYAEMHWRILALLLCGIGFGLFQAPNNHIILTVGPKHRSGAAGGMLGTARLTGQSLGAALAAGLFAFYPPPAATHGPQWAFAVAAVCALMAGISSILRKPAVPAAADQGTIKT
ncbi:MFS transporter [Lampropedia aestuarii]|uniref:MFS transporter n=1 Tax=Lampropedia aestuarii TaxID=2562762 RepID=UPI0024683555|nr:MFS transporter [Lampropedia aestuarii]MDH5855744.1 MFS transporter [Lampropedia aestuarii]